MTILLLLFMFFAGLSLILYPLISNYINSKTQSQAIASYSSALERAKADDFAQLFAEAEAYNEKLKNLPFPLSDFEQLEGYERLLTLENTNVMARISIERIAVDLPVYHGSSDAILSMAAGHLQGSSLPVGGGGTHAVMTAHRGLPSARLFSDLDQLELEDTFQITVLDRSLIYQVDQILTVEADELDQLRIVAGEDYCTLFTCTPYGINTHRLLVRGKRIEVADLEVQVAAPLHIYNTDPLLLMTLIFAAMLIARLAVLLINYRKVKDKR